MAFEYDYTVPEIAKRFGVCEVTVVDWIKKDKLHGDIFYGRRPKYRVLESEVLRFEKEDLHKALAWKKTRTKKESKLEPEPIIEDKPQTIDFAQFMDGLENFAKAIKNHPELVELIIECARKES